MFGHLQIYSCYSFQRSTVMINDLIEEAKKKNLKYLTLTDKDNMYAIMQFSKECIKNDITPLFGVEASIMIEHEIYPFILIAKDDIGYFSLVKIVSDINLSEKKSIELESLIEHMPHIYVISACNSGLIERLIVKEMEEQAEKYIRYFKEIFSDNYYIMIQNHHLQMQKHFNARMISLAKYLKVKIICSNEVRYLRPSDALAVDLLEASASNVQLEYQHEPITKEKYLKSEEEMSELFDKEIIEETRKVMQSCKVTIPLHNMHLPKFPVPHKGGADAYLRSLCKVGLTKRFKNKNIPSNYIQRLKYELSVIHKMGFDDYFLIVWDYVRYAKVNHILVGPGRGSAAGSLVAYVLGITNVDPIEYDLLFERFLNPERISMPDIDIDFQDDRRDEVVQYVMDKYGQEHAAQIVTFSTYGPRVAIKDIGKVMGIPLPRLELIAKMVPTGYKNKKTITEVYHSSAQFQGLIQKDMTLRKIISSMSIIEHLPRNISTHAAGVILSNERLDSIVPLVYGPSQRLMSQYSKDYIEEAGLLKMDFLGLKNLTMLDYICKDIKEYSKINLSLNELPLDDKKTYQLISKADTYGVFQLESQGMRNLLLKLKPRCFDDIVAAIALFRPGPMENIPAYLKRREGKEEITYLIDELKPILKSTYGIMVYQEQVMMIAQQIAGFSLGKADLFRKAISKKQGSLMISMKEDFIEGCIKNGFSKDKSIELFQLIEKFADYGFNKSHSVAYGIVAYQLAYLKANYPLYFFASILSNEQSSDYSKIHCIQEARRYGVKILTPSINYSSQRFLVEDGHIRYSLTAIKNVGYAGYKEIEEERKKGLFKDIYDFFTRTVHCRLTTKMIESLIDAGAFDEFKMNRATLKKHLKTIMDYAQLRPSLILDEEPLLTTIKEDMMIKLENEKKVLGLYLSMHPIELIKQKVNVPIVNIYTLDRYVNKQVYIVVQIQRVKNITDRKGNEMCFIEGIDETGSVDGVVFASVFKSIALALKKGNICLLYGNVDYKDKLSLIIKKADVLK